MEHIKVLDEIHNRNGISGRGFVKVIFILDEGQINGAETLTAIIPDDAEDSECYVFNPSDFSRMYRGDVIHQLLNK